MSHQLNANDICGVCEIQNENVIDGLCETCETVWLRQIGIISKQVTEDTSLAYVFHKAIEDAKVIVSKKKVETNRSLDRVHSQFVSNDK
jgi:hypothetical protein